MANKKDSKIYEASFHIIPTLSMEDGAKVCAGIRDGIAGIGEILSTEDMREVDLAYTIRHMVRQGDGSYNRYDTAYFGSVKFTASPSDAEKLRGMLRADDSILRFLIMETVAEDTRISSVLPGTEEESEPSPDAGESPDGADMDGTERKETAEDDGAPADDAQSAPSYGTMGNTVQYNI